MKIVNSEGENSTYYSEGETKTSGCSSAHERDYEEEYEPGGHQKNWDCRVY